MIEYEVDVHGRDADLEDDDVGSRSRPPEEMYIESGQAKTSPSNMSSKEVLK